MFFLGIFFLIGQGVGGFFKSPEEKELIKQTKIQQLEFEKQKQAEEQKKKLEEERIKKEKEAEEEKQRKIAEEERLKMEKQKYLNAEQPNYRELSRRPSDFYKKKVSFYGQIVQIIEQNNNKVEFRMYVTQNCNYTCIWVDDIYVTFRKEDSYNLLEEDIVTVYGDFKGVEKYETVLGVERSIPVIEAKYLKINNY